METTQIPCDQTVSEIQRELGKHGAAGIQLEYEKGEIKAVAFFIIVREQRVPFMLPCRWQAIHAVLVNRLRRGVRESREEWYIEQAKRVAWRQILRWIQAQLALVATEMVRIEEVFMPYLVVDKKGTTLFQRMDEAQFALPAPERVK